MAPCAQEAVADDDHFGLRGEGILQYAEHNSNPHHKITVAVIVMVAVHRNEE